MKFVLFALLLAAAPAMAQELDATEAAVRSLAVGSYQGQTPVEGDDCSVTVSRDSRGVTVLAQTGELSVSYLVKTGSVYRWRPGQRSFLSSFYSSSTETEQVYRTLAVGEDSQYVVVDRSEREEELKVECVVSL